MSMETGFRTSSFGRVSSRIPSASRAEMAARLRGSEGHIRNGQTDRPRPFRLAPLHRHSGGGFLPRHRGSAVRASRPAPRCGHGSFARPRTIPLPRKPAGKSHRHGIRTLPRGTRVQRSGRDHRKSRPSRAVDSRDASNESVSWNSDGLVEKVKTPIHKNASLVPPISNHPIALVFNYLRIFENRESTHSSAIMTHTKTRLTHC